MKLVSRRPRRRAGFTLIEMIGVLAIIAILASMLIPRIFSAINEARVTGTAFSYNGLKSAAITYFGKHGRIGGNGGTNFTAAQLTNGVSNWDRTYLLPGGFIESDLVDPRYFSAANIKNRLESYLQMVEARRAGGSREARAS